MNSTTQLIYGHGNPTTCYTIKHCGSIHNTKQIRIIMHVWPKTQPCGTNHIYNTNITSFITIHNYMTHTNKQPNFSHIYLSVLLSHTQIHTHTITLTQTYHITHPDQSGLSLWGLSVIHTFTHSKQAK